MQKLLLISIAAGNVAIIASDTMPGLVIRAALAAPFAWAGMIDHATYEAFALLYR